MKLLTSLLLTTVFFSSASAEESTRVLATTQGHYALGSVEETFAGVNRKVIYLIETKTGALWEKGCVKWDQNDKCITAGLRKVLIGDGTGVTKLFDSAKEATENAGFGSLLRDSPKK